MTFSFLSSRRRGLRGFTLIELVVVLLILAMLAGLVIPQIGMLGRSSDMAASAKTQSDLANNIQLYFVLQKRYPQGLDSLLAGGTAVYTPFDSTGALATNGDLQVGGLPVSGGGDVVVHSALVASAITGNFNRSLTRSGFEFIHDHPAIAAGYTGNANNSANTVRALSTNNTTGNICAEVSFISPEGAALIRRLAPAEVTEGTTPTLNPNVKFVAFGVGPRNAALGKTLTNSPIYPGCDGKYYGRYIAIFKLYGNGERATLAGVVDAYGRHSDYAVQQFNESLPDGARQG